MEKPTVTTREDAWFAYIAGLLEEIRDAMKTSESKVINISGNLDTQALAQVAKTMKQNSKRGGSHGKDV